MNNRGETLVVVPCWWDGALQRYFPSFLPHFVLFIFIFLLFVLLFLFLLFFKLFCFVLFGLFILCSSLAATVRLKRNDLLKDFESTLCAPIPPEPPPGYFKGKYKWDKGE